MTRHDAGIIDDDINVVCIELALLPLLIILNWIFVLNELDNHPNRVVLVICLLKQVICSLDFWKLYWHVPRSPLELSKKDLLDSDIRGLSNP